jgi:hypothetical protein
MATLLRNESCPACGKRHHFTTTQGGVSAGEEYAYVCPETGGRSRLRPQSDGENVSLAPCGAVVLTRPETDATDARPAAPAISGAAAN